MAKFMKRISLKWPLIIFSSFLSIIIFIVPLYGASLYSFRGEGGKGHSLVNYQWLLHQDGFYPSLFTSLKLAVLAGLLNLILMVPTMVYLNLKGQRYKSLVDFLCILPLIIPVVSLAIGAQVAMPKILQNSEYELVFFFVIIALPYTYRALDTSLQTVALKTLVEASRSLGATWTRTIIRVIVPAIRSGITGALFLTFALSIGEYTITSLLHWETFPTWTVVAAQQNILGAIAISVFSFVGAIALLSVIALFSKKSAQKAEVEE
jgi:putative spermidine/putrescine transport system permease protein